MHYPLPLISGFSLKWLENLVVKPQFPNANINLLHMPCFGSPGSSESSTACHQPPQRSQTEPPSLYISPAPVMSVWCHYLRALHSRRISQDASIGNGTVDGKWENSTSSQDTVHTPS